MFINAGWFYKIMVYPHNGISGSYQKKKRIQFRNIKKVPKMAMAITAQ